MNCNIKTVTKISNLTAKESSILALLSQGKTNKEIAKQLRIAVRTVEYHITQIFCKLGVSNRTEAAILAREKLSKALEKVDGNPQ